MPMRPLLWWLVDESSGDNTQKQRTYLVLINLKIVTSSNGWLIRLSHIDSLFQEPEGKKVAFSAGDSSINVVVSGRMDL